MPECGYCKDCKHWDAFPHSPYDEYIPRGSCKRINEAGALGFEKAAVEEQTDTEHFNGILLTEEDFGCVLFEPKI